MWLEGGGGVVVFTGHDRQYGRGVLVSVDDLFEGSLAEDPITVENR